MAALHGNVCVCVCYKASVRLLVGILSINILQWFLESRVCITSAKSAEVVIQRLNVHINVILGTAVTELCLLAASSPQSLNQSRSSTVSRSLSHNVETCDSLIALSEI